MQGRIVNADRLYNRALICSILIHALLLLTLPGLKLLESIEVSEWLEVDLMAPEDAIDVQTSTDVAPIKTTASGVVDTDPIGESPLFPSPPVWLPERLNTINSEPVPMRLTIPADLESEIAGSGISAPGMILAGSDAALDEPSMTTLGEQPPEMAWQPSRPKVIPSEDDDSLDSLITGEVANRKVLYRPPSPRPTANMSGTVLLKFWVQPDGTIGKIVPITRSDPELERVALDYFEKWRFESVRSEIGVQSGTIPIRFKVH